MFTPVTVAVTTLFYEDHVARDCGQTGKVLRSGKRLTTVLLDEESYKDLLSDADYYRTLEGGYPEEAALSRSAEATYQRLIAA